MEEKENKLPEEKEQQLPSEKKSFFLDSKKKTIFWGIIAALALVVGIVLIVIFGGGEVDAESEFKNNKYVTVTDTNGDVVTDTNGEAVTVPVTGTGLEQGGANTEGGWGQIITP